MAERRALLVGEANPYGGDPGYALWTEPAGCAGERLCRLVMGLEPAEYYRRFERMNLCHREWKMKEARARASVIPYATYTKVVLLGAKVRQAFGVEGANFTTQGPFVILPHPSGLCREWHKPGAFERAREVLRGAGVL